VPVIINPHLNPIIWTVVQEFVQFQVKNLLSICRIKKRCKIWEQRHQPCGILYWKIHKLNILCTIQSMLQGFIKWNLPRCQKDGNNFLS